MSGRVLYREWRVGGLFLTRIRKYLPFLDFLSLYIQLYAPNKNTWIDFNQVCELSQTRHINGKIIAGSQIALLTNFRVLIFK